MQNTLEQSMDTINFIKFFTVNREIQKWKNMMTTMMKN